MSSEYLQVSGNIRAGQDPDTSREIDGKDGNKVVQVTIADGGVSGFPVLI